MTWRSPCQPRAIIDEIQLTDSQWEAYLKALHQRTTVALAAAARWLEDRPG